ncbi:MAG: DUF512 domain-containing protein [Actinobacteria bacterium]|nr:DUF512 domain-containing protein [Actinomycetota bacterium]
MSDYSSERCYAPSEAPGKQSGLIASVEKGSPAEEAGLQAGMVLTHVDGVELHDLIDWLWLSDEMSIEVFGVAPCDEEDETGEEEDESCDGGTFEFEAILEREPGQVWGVEFEECIFDSMRLCKNACIFCFMTMLPPNMRETLYLRDDDYRLSFLQGNFVTLTNTTDEDIQRIIEMNLSPLHVSVHAISADVRKRLIGKYEARGREALEELLDAGIGLHTQIVLVPGINDGEELSRTLSWLEAHENVLSCGIVPLGYTRHQTRFDRSYNDASDAREIIEALAPYQEHARQKLGRTRFHLADEFYLNAGIEVPAAEFYDGFEQYEDGIGMVRSFIDDWDAAIEAPKSVSWLESAASSGKTIHLICGEAFGKFFAPLLEGSGLRPCIDIVSIRNDFFGGNVDVSGLLCGSDVLRGIENIKYRMDSEDIVALPSIMFNACGVTLDDCTISSLSEASGVELNVVSSTVEGLVSMCAEYFG